MELLRSKKIYTYADYLTWRENERWEVIDGAAYMQATPTWQHQSVSGELYRQISNYLVNKRSKVFISPFDLCFAEYDESDNVIKNIVQPDIMVVCDETKLRKTGYFGVPKLVVEVSLPSTTRIDRVVKFNMYEKAGIMEYWIVEPAGKYISVFTLQENERYGRPESYTEEEKVPVYVLPDLVVDLKPVFKDFNNLSNST